MFCSKCGYNVPKGKKSCPNCGQAAEFSQSCGGFYDIVKEDAGRGEMSSLSQQPAPNGSKLPIILCIISMLIAIGSLGGVFMMKQQVDQLQAKIEEKADKKDLDEKADQTAIDQNMDQLKAVEEFIAAKHDKEDLFMRYLKYRGFEGVDMADFEAMVEAENQEAEKQQESQEKEEQDAVSTDEDQDAQENESVATTTETNSEETNETDE